MLFTKKLKNANLVVSAKQMKTVFGHNIAQGSIKPIDRVIKFTSKFPNEIKDKTQLQRLLGSISYTVDFYQDLAKDAKPLYA